MKTKNIKHFDIEYNKNIRELYKEMIISYREIKRQL